MTNRGFDACEIGVSLFGATDALLGVTAGFMRGLCGGYAGFLGACGRTLSLPNPTSSHSFVILPRSQQLIFPRRYRRWRFYAKERVLNRLSASCPVPRGPIVNPAPSYRGALRGHERMG